LKVCENKLKTTYGRVISCFRKLWQTDLKLLMAVNSNKPIQTGQIVSPPHHMTVFTNLNIRLSLKVHVLETNTLMKCSSQCRGILNYDSMLL